MTDLSNELLQPLRQARAYLREPGPAAIDRAMPLFLHAIQALSQVRDAGVPPSPDALARVKQARHEVAAIGLLLDRSALLYGTWLQGLTDRSRRESAAAEAR